MYFPLFQMGLPFPDGAPFPLPPSLPMLISRGTKQQQPQFQQISVCALVYHRAGFLISSLWPMDCDWILHISRGGLNGGLLWYQPEGLRVLRFY